MGRIKSKTDYESLRNARISENQARLVSLGIDKSVNDLRAVVSSPKAIKTPTRKYEKKALDRSYLRRSDRLKGKTPDPEPMRKLYFSEPTRTRSMKRSEEEEKRPANAPLLSMYESEIKLPSHVLARRCDSKGRGSVYDPVLGICCHFCRQKKLCGEEDCERCGNGDTEQPCLGKTDCSVCHSTNGVLCRACLKVRYGEEMEEVRKNKSWTCPHCIEEKGTKPYWICNSSFCLKKRKIAPTGIAIYEAREKGYASVAHLLMDQLKQGARW